MAGLQRARLKVGLIPIIDCAPVVLAEALGTTEARTGNDPPGAHGESLVPPPPAEPVVDDPTSALRLGD